MILLFLFLTLSLFGNDAPCVLVVGGAGYIGSHVNEMLARRGYQTIVLDDLSTGYRKNVIHGVFVEGSLEDKSLLDRLFKDYAIDAVMHFAASSDVRESVLDPLKYYTNNVSNALNLLEVMKMHGVKAFIFSSSCCVFGKAEGPLSEGHLRDPINPYGRSKLMIEWILEDLDRTCGLRYCTLRYFNAAGGDPRKVIKQRSVKDPHLIPTILRGLLNDNGSVTIHGISYSTPDGTCIRDYVHVEDLGEAHIAAMESLLKGGPSRCYNLGNGKGTSVKEVITAVERVTGKSIQITEGPPRPGDAEILIADIRNARAGLHWEPKYSIEAMIEHAWNALQPDFP
jgi:UDP-glucose 4-epimerase